MRKNYPSQEEAEALLDSVIYTAGIVPIAGDENCITGRIMQKTVDDLRERYQCVFNHPECSPWEVVEIRGCKQVAWRQGWGEK